MERLRGRAVAADSSSPPPPNPPSSSGTDPDWLLKKIGGFLVAGAANVALSVAIKKEIWAVLPPTVFVLAALAAGRRDAVLRPHRGERGTRILAVVLLLVYLGVAIWGR